MKSKSMEEYILLFGASDLIPEMWFSSTKYKNVDEVYSECVKRRITWRKLTGWNEDKKKGVLL